MMSLEQAIAQYEQFANVCEHHGLTASQEEFEQLAAWLRELKERRDEPEERTEKRMETHGVCLDAISRQAAIDICANAIDLWHGQLGEGALVAVRDKIAELTPAEPKTGRWIYCEDTTADCVDGYRCDQCGLFVPWDYQHKSIDYIKDYNFCPNCGAKMTISTK